MAQFASWTPIPVKYLEYILFLDMAHVNVGESLYHSSRTTAVTKWEADFQ